MAKKKHKAKADGAPTFPCMNHGGKRKGAGRKAKRHGDGSRVEPSHAERPSFTKHRPLHITLEMAQDVPNLRAVNLAVVVIGAIGRANVREDFLRTKAEVRNAVRYVLRNAEHHGLHESWPGGAWPGSGGAGSSGLPCPDPLSTAAWFPYWAERELFIAPTQIPASVVRPAQCFLMKLAFEDSPLSFAEPMVSASTRRARATAKETSQHGSRAHSRPKEVARVQEVGTAPSRVPPRRQVLL